NLVSAPRKDTSICRKRNRAFNVFRWQSDRGHRPDVALRTITRPTYLNLTSDDLPPARPSPFKGEDRRGMGVLQRRLYPIPTPTLPLKGRESFCKRKIVASQGIFLWIL